MTIAYPDSFHRSLLMWKGSLWKAVIWDMLAWYLAYYVIMVITYFAITSEEAILRWHHVIDYFEKGTGYIPLTFLLGFFVTTVLNRWWAQFKHISYPDNLMLAVAAGLPGKDNLPLRRTIARWVNLQAAMAWRLISVRTKARFPTIDHLIEAKLMTKSEKALYDAVDSPYGKFFVPSIWLVNLVSRLHSENVIVTTIQYKQIMTEIRNYKAGFAALKAYDWIGVPLVYTQVVAIATYGFAAFCLVARQPKFYPDTVAVPDTFSLPFPLFTSLQMLFYLGWLKVAQVLMHPFGDDDDDFELNWILDRNTSISYLLADPWSSQIPDTVEDPFEGNQRVKLPHTRASMKIRDTQPPDSLADLVFKEKHLQTVSVEESERLFLQKETSGKFPSVGRTKIKRDASAPKLSSFNAA